MAACPGYDFTDKPLCALNEVQRLSFTGQMLRTEYERCGRRSRAIELPMC